MSISLTSQDEEIILEDYESDGEGADSGLKRRTGEVDDDEEDKEDYSLRVLV